MGGGRPVISGWPGESMKRHCGTWQALRRMTADFHGLRDCPERRGAYDGRTAKAVAMIPKESIEQVLSATDIVELVGSYVPLKRAGSQFRANCPFHHEKTPSFYVNPARLASLRTASMNGRFS